MAGERTQTRPELPAGASTPESSRRDISNPGHTLPIEPNRFSPDGGLSVATPISVIP